MVTASARRGALLALLVLFALPSAAHALAWKACPDFEGVRCSSVTVPLDRTGALPGTSRCVSPRSARRRAPTLMYLSGGPGGAG